MPSDPQFLSVYQGNMIPKYLKNTNIQNTNTNTFISATQLNGYIIS